MCNKSLKQSHQSRFLSINPLFNIIVFLCVYNGLDTNCTVQTHSCLHNMYVKVTVHLLTGRVISFKVRLQ